MEADEIINTVTGQEETFVEKVTPDDILTYVFNENSTRRLLKEDYLIIGDVYVEDDDYAMKLNEEMTIESEDGKTIVNLNISEIVKKFGK